MPGKMWFIRWFWLFNKKSNIFIWREISKRTHCPSILTLALLLFVYIVYRVNINFNFPFAFSYWKIKIIFPTSRTLRNLLQNNSSKTFIFQVGELFRGFSVINGPTPISFLIVNVVIINLSIKLIIMLFLDINLCSIFFW